MPTRDTGTSTVTTTGVNTLSLHYTVVNVICFIRQLILTEIIEGMSKDFNPWFHSVISVKLRKCLDLTTKT